MTGLVLDASIAAAWLFDDEDDRRAEAAMARLEAETAVVPQLWHFEIHNVLLVAERRGRITAEAVTERLAALRDLPIHTDTLPELNAALTLARRHGLSFYDALYLELAQRLNAALASLDRALLRAAAAESVPLPLLED